MKIVGVRIVRFAIPFREPLRVGSRLLRERRGCFVELRDETGCSGVGEAAPWPGASASRLSGIERDLQRMCDALSAHTSDFVTLLRLCEGARYGETRAAVEMALYDLEATSKGRRVADLLGTVRRTKVPLNALLARDWSRAAAAARESGFACLKLKIDGRAMRRSCAALREVRDQVGGAMRIRIDVNCAWSVEEATRWIPRLAECGIEYIEQPVASIAELARVRSAVGVPIAADECVTGEAAVRAIAAARAADVIVVKPALVGLTEATRIVRAAEECGLDVVITSTLDTSIGIAAALHLAATLSDPIRHCGLATAPLLAGDLVRDRLLPARGLLHLGDTPGLGVRVNLDDIEQWGRDAVQTAVSF